MAAETVGFSIASKVVELLIEPTIRQFRYVFYFNNYVEDFTQQERNLTFAQGRVQRAVYENIRNGEEIEEDVEAWLVDANKAIEDVEALKEDIGEDKRCFSTWFPNWFWRYKLGRKVAKKTSNLIKLQERGKFQQVSHQVAPPAIEFLPNAEFMPSLSTNLARNQIVEALKDDNVNMIGLYGMGGVGKTTSVKEIGSHATELKLFDLVLMLVISKTQDVLRVQDQLAGKLHLYLKEACKEERASRLWQRLKTEKKILIILDDMWKNIDLKGIGIPFGEDHKGCKILVTTRLQHVCTSMKCQRVVMLDVLSENEAWELFKINAGLGGDPRLNDVAVEVAKECRGLPIAIVTLGRALRGKSRNSWDAACKRLKRSELLKIEDVDIEENAYVCLKLSYDHLNNWETKLCFLLCSLFPEDHEVAVEDLVRCAVGLGLYQDMDSIEDARKEVFAAIEKLKASCLLLEAESGGHAKMHDMVRDFALWISKAGNVFDVKDGIGLKERPGIEGLQNYRATSIIGLKEWVRTESLQNYTAISFLENNMRKLPEELVYPNLKMLFLARQTTRSNSLNLKWSFMAGHNAPFNSDLKEEFTYVSDASFKDMKELEVLSFCRGFLSMQSLEFLTNLQTLELKYCCIHDPASEENNMNFASIRILKRLKILSFHGSYIKELPSEIGELNDLKLLDLTSCDLLERIPPNVIDRLFKLEEFYIGRFEGWEVEEINEERRNASLMELNSLSHLAVLWLNLNVLRIPADFAVPCLNKYCIHMNCGCIQDPKPRYPTTRTICYYPMSSTITKISKLFSNAYDLHLTENEDAFQNIIPDMDQSGLNDLISLSLGLCGMKCLVSTIEQIEPPTVFSNLEEISMWKTSVGELCDGNPPEGFLKNLKQLSMSASYMLTIFPSKLWQALQNLERVTIDWCDSLQELFLFDGLHHEEDKRLLSNLAMLQLNGLRKLKCIWMGPTCHVSLESLTSVNLANCSSLTNVFSLSLAQTLVHLQTLSIKRCNKLKHVVTEKNENEQEVLAEAHPRPLSLQNLKTLTIHECDALEYVFPTSIIQGLLHLEEINIEHAAKLRQFFSSGEPSVLFRDEINNPQSRMQVPKCPSELGYFCSGSSAVKLPSLKHVHFIECPKLLMNSIAKIPIPLKEPENSKASGAEETDGIQLERITLIKCGNLEHVIAKYDDGERSQSSIGSHFLLPCFNNLHHIQIIGCRRLKSLFPIIILEGLTHLVYLRVEAAFELMEMFGCEGVIDKKELTVPKLTRLWIARLPSLIGLCSEAYQIMFPSLERLTVKKCPKLTTIFSISEPSHCVHAETKAPQIIREDTATTSTATTVASKSINWKREENLTHIPYNDEEEDNDENEDKKEDEDTNEEEDEDKEEEEEEI